MDIKATEERLQKARNIVYRLLQFRSRSEQELRDKLKTKKLPTPIVEQTIQYFKECDLVDDQLFARQWTSSRLKKPFGLNRIKLELKSKGIDGKVIDNAFKDATDHYDERAVVTQLACRQAQKYSGIDPKKVKQRIYGYLMRRGFSSNIIMDVVNNL